MVWNTLEPLAPLTRVFVLGTVGQHCLHLLSHAPYVPRTQPSRSERKSLVMTAENTSQPVKLNEATLAEKNPN